MMVDANICVVLIGIETPNEAARRDTRKLQNLRKGAMMLEKVHTIQRAGIQVWCGMILGFDSCDAAIFDAQRAFIKQAWIVNAVVTMLAAIPKDAAPCAPAQGGKAGGCTKGPARWLDKQPLGEGLRVYSLPRMLIVRPPLSWGCGVWDPRNGLFAKRL